MEHGVAAQDQVESGVQTVGDNVVLLKILYLLPILERSTWKKSRKFESNLECPGLVLEPLLVFVNIGLCDVKPKVVHIRSLVQEVRHPVHVPTGRVKEAYSFLAKNFLEVISNFK